VYDLIHRHLGVRPRFKGPRSVPTSVCLWLYQWSMSHSTGIVYFRANIWAKCDTISLLKEYIFLLFLKKKKNNNNNNPIKRDFLLFHKSGRVWKQNDIDPRLTFLSLYIQKFHISPNSPLFVCMPLFHWILRDNLTVNYRLQVSNIS
jgi:hypothetical protein